MKNKSLVLLSCLTFLLSSKSIGQLVPVFSHIVVVIGENTASGSVYGNANAPYINALAGIGAKFTNSFGITHPSQPNYLDLYSGGNQGITNDNLNTTKFTSANLGAELISASKTYATFSDGLPSIGYDGATSGNYVRKHNPAANWMGIGLNQIPTTTNQPFTALPSNFNTLPSVSFVIPDLCHDGHNVCAPISNSVKQYDTWLQQNIDSYKQWCINNNSLLIVTYDEDDNSSSNKIATIFYGAHVVPGVYSQTINHYIVLRTLEEANNLSAHAGSAATVAAIDYIWDAVLPLKLLSFNGIKQASSAKLNWVTTNEINFSGFDIERSINGAQFVTLGNVRSMVPASLNNVYSYLDRYPMGGVDVYRLKLIDKDGNFTYSKQISIEFPNKTTAVILPNPVHDMLNISAGSAIKEVKLISLSGIVLKTWPDLGATANLDISEYPSGVYILKLFFGSDSETVKIIKD